MKLKNGKWADLFFFVFLGMTFFLLNFNSPQALAETSIAGIGILNFSRLHSTNGGIVGHPHLGVGAGLLLTLPFVSDFNLEAGGLYVHRRTSSASTYAIEVPVLVRYSLVPGFSIGAGGYWVAQTSAPDTLQDYDFGLAASLALTIPFFSVFNLLLDGRYLYGLYNVAVADASLYRDAQFFVGLKVNFN